MSEQNVMQRIIKYASKRGSTLFRNNIGETWIGKSRYFSKTEVITVNRGDVLIKHARRFHAGLCEGSGDTIGITPVEITPDMVGQVVGVFTNIEVKKDEKAAKAASKSKMTREVNQQKFVNFVRNNGGYAGFAGSEDQAEDIFKGGGIY